MESHHHHHHSHHITPLTFLAAFALWSPGVAMLENGTSIEYLMECSSCTTTLDTFLNDSLRRCAAPSAVRTCSVLNNNSCNRRWVQLWLYSTISTVNYFRPQVISSSCGRWYVGCTASCTALAGLCSWDQECRCFNLWRKLSFIDETTFFKN
jgi:hypothetical protein